MPESEDGTTHDGFSEDEEGFDFDAYVTQNLNVSLKIFTKLNFIFLLSPHHKGRIRTGQFWYQKPNRVAQRDRLVHIRGLLILLAL